MKMQNTKKRIRIGIMGCASIAQRMVIPAIKELTEDFELIAIASRTMQKASDFANLFDSEPIESYQTLIERDDIDAIYIPLPTGMHYEWILKSLEAGKHVISEKSLTVDYKETKHLVEVAKSKNLLLMENFMFKYHKQHLFVKECMENTKFGSIKLFRSQFGFPPLKFDNFRYDNELGGGSLLDAGAYTIMASRMFFGNNQEVISSVLNWNKDNNVDITGTVTLKSKQGIISQLSFGFDNYYQCNYEFWFSKARLFVGKAFTPKSDEKTMILYETADSKELVEIEPDNHFINILLEFKKNIMDGNYDMIYNDLLDQSRTLTDVRIKAINIYL